MLFGWGANSYGQLGLGYDSEQENLPKRVETTSARFVKLTGGGGHTLAVTEDGRLFGCGWNQVGTWIIKTPVKLIILRKNKIVRLQG